MTGGCAAVVVVGGALAVVADAGAAVVDATTGADAVVGGVDDATSAEGRGDSTDADGLGSFEPLLRPTPGASHGAMAPTARTTSAIVSHGDRFFARPSQRSFVTADASGGSCEADFFAGGSGVGASTVEVTEADACVIAVTAEVSGRGGGGGKLGVAVLVPSDSRTTFSASNISPALAKRELRSMRSARCTIVSSSAGIDEPLALGGGTFSVRTFTSTATRVDAAWAGAPVSIS